jgi:hypothetical protein
MCGIPRTIFPSRLSALKPRCPNLACVARAPHLGKQSALLVTNEEHPVLNLYLALVFV